MGKIVGQSIQNWEEILENFKRNEEVRLTAYEEQKS